MTANAAWTDASASPGRGGTAELAGALRLSGFLALGAALATAPCVLSAIGTTSRSAGAFQEPFLAIELILAAALALGAALAAGEIRLARARVLLPLAILVLWTAARALWAREPVAAEREVVRWAEALIVLLVVLLLVRRRGEARALGALLVACACAYAVYGLFQRWVLMPGLEREAIRDPGALHRAAGLAIDPAARLRIMDRGVYGPFSISNHFAAYLGAALCVLAALAVARARRRSRAAILSILPVALLVLVLVLTESKGAWLAAAAGLGALALVLTVPEEKKRRGWALALGALALAAAAVWLLPDLRAHFAGSVRVRLGYWGGAWRMIREHPFFGVGPGGYAASYWRYKLAVASEAAEPHNQLISTWAELGLAGLAAYLWVWLALLRDAPARVATLAVPEGPDAKADAEEVGKVRAFIAFGGAGGLAAAALFLPWGSAGGLAALAALAAYVAAYVLFSRPAAEEEDSGGAGGAWRFGAACGAGVIGLHALIDYDLRTAGLLVTLALLIGLAAMRGRAPVRFALNARRRAMLAAALLSALALGGFYGIWRPLAMASGSLEAENAPTYAARALALEGVVRAVPGDWRSRQELGRAYEAMGRPEDARRAFEGAIRFAPDRPWPRAVLGEFLLRRGRPREAAARLVEARVRYPARAPSHVAEGDALLLAGGREAAAAAYARALGLDRVLDERDGGGTLFTLFERPGGLPLHAPPVLERLVASLGDAPALFEFAWRRALASCELGKWEAAVARFGALAGAAPEDVQPAVFLGYALRGAGRGEEAERAWRSALARLGEVPESGRLPRRTVRRAIWNARHADRWRRRREAEKMRERGE